MSNKAKKGTPPPCRDEFSSAYCDRDFFLEASGYFRRQHAHPLVVLGEQAENPAQHFLAWVNPQIRDKATLIGYLRFVLRQLETTGATAEGSKSNVIRGT